MGEEDADAARGEALERGKRSEHDGGRVFVAAGEERGERVDHHQVETGLVRQRSETINHLKPLFGARFAAEWAAKPGNVVAEGEFGGTESPEVGAFLGEDNGLAWLDLVAGEVATRSKTVEKDGNERGFACFPEAGKQGDRAAGEVAVPDPGDIGVGGAA
jgi:hypothetical protein